MTSIFSSGSDYEFTAQADHTAGYLHQPIIRICKELTTSKVFDLGCGNGHLCAALFGAGFQVSGCDPSESGIAEARRLLPNVSFIQGSLYDSPDPLLQGSWDAVVSTEVIEHLFHPRYLPRFASTLLRDGGFLILSTPYHGYFKNLLIAFFGKWDFHHTALWDGGHVKFWSRKTLGKLLEEEGFRVQHFEGAGRIRFLWKSMILVAQKLPKTAIGNG